MFNLSWKKFELPINKNQSFWEEYYENSKTKRYSTSLSDTAVAKEMENLYDSFPYKNSSSIQLSESFYPMPSDFMKIILNRKTARTIESTMLSLLQLKTIMYCGYGITRPNISGNYVRPLRTVPSGGALYPLELYFYSNGYILDLVPGLYHYSPSKNSIHLVSAGDITKELAKCFVDFQSNLAYDTSLLIFITAVFRKSIFKYGEKGFRFTLLEAGHVAQNINLAATAMSLGVINIGGFFESAIDELLGIDGLNHSTVYISGIGK